MADPTRQTGRGGAGMGADPDPGSSGQGGNSGGDPAVGEMGIPLPTGDKPHPSGGTLNPDFEDITEPTGDANSPEPSKPISMASRPGQGESIPQGGYGDSRGQGDANDPTSTDIRSGGHLDDDDSQSETDRPQGSDDQAGYPKVSQPANVDEVG